MDQMRGKTAAPEETRDDLQEILKRTSLVVFFANQLRLLEYRKYRDASQGLEQGSLRISQVHPRRAAGMQASTNCCIERSGDVQANSLRSR